MITDTYESDEVFVVFNPHGNTLTVRLMTEERAAELARDFPNVNTFLIEG